MKAMKRYSSLHSLTTEHHELASGWDWSGEAMSALVDSHIMFAKFHVGSSHPEYSVAHLPLDASKFCCGSVDQ